MNSSLYIVTGGSNGFGQALVLELLQQGQNVLSISRSMLPAQKNLQQIKIDFSRPFQARLQTQLKKLNAKKLNAIYLINNAGIIDPIARVENLKELDVLKSFKVNLIAPIIMSQLCLKIFGKKNKVIVQITSGAATRPMEGWSVYGAGKAGLDMFNQVLALQMKNDSSFKTMGYSPGVMDTKMQSRIRQSSTQQFPAVNEFKKYKNEKSLRSPQLVAKDLLKILQQPENITSGEVYRISF